MDNVYISKLEGKIQRRRKSVVNFNSSQTDVLQTESYLTQKSKQCSCRIHFNPTKPICTAHRQNDHPTTRLLELLWAAKNIILKNLFETLTITSVGMYCFYLSLSASYMANIPSSCGMFVNRALALKVSINAFPGGTPCWLIFLFLFFCILYV